MHTEKSRTGTGDRRILLVRGDIAKQETDAVVTPANPRLSGCEKPGCADYAVHAAAGEQLRRVCEAQMEKIREKLGAEYVQPVGIPMMTDAFGLRAKKIIHVVPPVVKGPLSDVHREQLALCYRNTLMLCASRGMTSVAFCCLSTGEGAFPRDEAARIAVDAVRTHPGTNGGPGRVVFVVYTDEDMEAYRSLLGEDAS